MLPAIGSTSIFGIWPAVREFWYPIHSFMDDMEVYMKFTGYRRGSYGFLPFFATH
jgi:hypothetical protein